MVIYSYVSKHEFEIRFSTSHFWMVWRYWVMITNHKILFISFFLYFIIVRKSIRTFKKKNDEINGNKEISFGSSKKGIGS
jgi:hypothetical protein